MTKPEVLEKTAMSVVEVKEALKKIQKRDEELNFRSNRTLEYVNEVAQIKPKEAKEMVKKIKELEVPRLKDEFIKKIVDIMPRSEKSMQSLITDQSMTVSKENVKKIAAIVAEFVPKEKGAKKKAEVKEEKKEE